jgi:hypothetical protein
MASACFISEPRSFIGVVSLRVASDSAPDG